MARRSQLFLLVLACVSAFVISFMVMTAELLVAAEAPPGGGSCPCFYECPGVGLVVPGYMVNGHCERCNSCRLPE